VRVLGLLFWGFLAGEGVEVGMGTGMEGDRTGGEGEGRIWEPGNPISTSPVRVSDPVQAHFDPDSDSLHRYTQSAISGEPYPRPSHSDQPASRPIPAQQRNTPGRKEEKP